MQVRNGDLVVLRDKRIVLVTDAADSHPDAWRTYDKYAYEARGEWVVNSEMPAETIFVGKQVFFGEGNGGTDAMTTGGTVVSDMSEVVSIID